MVGLRKLDPPYNNVSLSAQDSISDIGRLARESGPIGKMPMPQRMRQLFSLASRAKDNKDSSIDHFLADCQSPLKANPAQ